MNDEELEEKVNALLNDFTEAELREVFFQVQATLKDAPNITQRENILDTLRIVRKAILAKKIPSFRELK